MKIKPIEWTEPQKPAGVGDVPYDHVKGTCPLGEFLITWKSWKDYPSYCIDETPWNEWGGVAETLEEAKQMAWDKYSELIGACIEGYKPKLSCREPVGLRSTPAPRYATAHTETMMQNMAIFKLENFSEGAGTLCTTQEAIDSAIAEIKRLLEVEHRCHVLVEHMAEVKAIADGNTTNTLTDVVEHCLEELNGA